LSGKLVYLVDCLFDNSEQILLQLQHWLPTTAAVLNADHQARESWEYDPACAHA